MSGCSLPVVINSGSGNQGMTVSLPVIEFAKEWNVSQEKLYRALVVSNLIAVHQKNILEVFPLTVAPSAQAVEPAPPLPIFPADPMRMLA